MMKLISVMSLFLLLPGCTSSCNKDKKNDGTKTSVEASEQVKSGSVATVNGKEVSKDELEKLHKRAVEKFAKTNRVVSEDLSRKMRSSILTKLIDDEIIRQKAESLGITVDRFEKVEALEQYKARLGGPKGFEIFLEQQNLTEEQVLETVTSDLIREKIAQKSGGTEVSEEEIQSHYRANPQLYMKPEMVRVRHILIKTNANEPKERQELALKKANMVVKEAQSKKENFEKLVQKYSEGPSVAQNGDIGFIPRGRMVKQFEDAAFSAPLKTAVGPVKTDFGYHIIYVEEKSQAKTAPIEEVRPRIVEFMKRNKQARSNENLLDGLRKEYKIKINDYSLTVQDYLDITKVKQAAK